MSEKIVDLIQGTAMALTGVTPIVKLQSKLAQDAVAPSTTKGTDKGDTPYRQAVLKLVNSAGVVAVYTVGRPNPRMGGVGLWAPYAQAIRCDGVNYKFTTKFTYAAFSLHNWIVELNGVPLTYDATPADLTEFDINDVGGYAQVEIGDGTPLPAGEISVISATPLKKTLLSSALNAEVEKIVNPSDYVYCEATAGNFTKANLTFFYR